MSLATVQDILAGWPGWAELEMNFGDQTSGQGSGETIVKELRPPLWSLHAESRNLSPNEIRIWKAKLEGLSNGKKLFLGYDFASKYPLRYPNGTWPTGSGFDGISAKVHAFGVDGVSLSLDTLPAGYQGSIGDMISATYGSGDPAALCLLRVVEAFTADGTGVTGTFEVRGDMPAGVDVGDMVAVKQPSCHMIIVPGSVKVPNDSTARGKISFDAIQRPTP